MAFSGTIQKCKACDKTVHFVEMVSADGIPYHKTCFKCTHCNGKLVMSSYFQLDGSLYCKPHFDQKFKEMGGISRIPSANKASEMGRNPSKLSSMFSGTQDKCAVCHKTVYPLEKVTVEGDFYHKQCFKCAQGGCKLTPSNYAALDGNLFCRPHFSQLFKEKGNYAHLKKAASMKKNESTEKLADQVTSEEGAPEASE
ncbi:LIM domain-containing protein WLIM2b-like [Cynara cardunculus var. scolymus]|uniref:LIM domain-containing protein WLIM2b-like n=1 Tax=Cynara cardunculus var. scolymus TaxID=59895 RepID=UPI000D631625|nr:LIM domain-containing protein WLIM2b-like [Cynara cardunculus var. scolymus]